MRVYLRLANEPAARIMPVIRTHHGPALWSSIYDTTRQPDELTDEDMVTIRRVLATGRYEIVPAR